MKALTQTNFSFPKQTSSYKGKVRDTYSIGDEILVMITTDRISAFDVILPKGIPLKGQILNQIAIRNLEATRNIIPNWLISSPSPVVAIGHQCVPYKVEMVVRGYLAGHAWRIYKKGLRTICGITLPDGLTENAQLPAPIITPTTKADEGHDEDITREEILASGLVSESEYSQLEKHALALFAFGTQEAAKRGLILVDTKYEFGKSKDGTIMLIDEVHTPDSSRFFYKEGYSEALSQNRPQRQLSKEFVREWLMENGFEGKSGQAIPDLPESFITEVTARYRELYEHFTGETFEPCDYTSDPAELESTILQALENQFHSHQA
jgi:phosphoribosylaminoimidazole-succinocarboxamide synthase